MRNKLHVGRLFGPNQLWHHLTSSDQAKSTSMRLAKTVMTILCLTSVRSSGRAYTGAPIILASVMAYLALL